MDDFSDMRTFELAFALGMAETITDEEIEKDDDNLFDD